MASEKKLPVAGETAVESTNLTPTAKADTVISVDHETGIIVVETSRKAGESVTARINDKQRTATVDGGQLWFRLGDSLPFQYSLVID